MFYAGQHDSKKKNGVWFLDSSNHMTIEKDIFLNMDPTFNSKVKVGNGVVVEEKGECSIGVETKKEKKM